MRRGRASFASLRRLGTCSIRDVRVVLRVVPVVLAAVFGTVCAAPRTLPACVEAPPDGGPTIETGGDPVLLAAGDIANVSDLTGARETAKLLDGMNGVVAPLGDEVAGEGTLDELLDAYAPTWGRHRWRTRPAVGNHEYLTPHAGPYFAYFCAAAGEPFRAYYSYDLGTWHVVVLDSQCAEDNGTGPACDEGSDQVRWLEADLAAHPAACTLAYFHHPRFTSGFGGDQTRLVDIWRALHAGGVDVVLNGHSHHYERFAPMTPDGVLDPARGLREIIVGTGGAALTSVGSAHANSETILAGVWGVLALTLRPSGYEWRFVAVDGSVRDAGSESCR